MIIYLCMTTFSELLNLFDYLALLLLNCSQCLEILREGPNCPVSVTRAISMISIVWFYVLDYTHCVKYVEIQAR